MGGDRLPLTLPAPDGPDNPLPLLLVDGHNLLWAATFRPQTGHPRRGLCPPPGDPRQWVDFRALTGDPADDIPGVRGIGAKTAATLLEGGLTLEDLPASGRLATGRGRAVADQFDLALKWRDMIRLDTDLVLPRWPTSQASPLLPRPADVVEELSLW